MCASGNGTAFDADAQPSLSTEGAWEKKRRDSATWPEESAIVNPHVGRPGRSPTLPCDDRVIGSCEERASLKGRYSKSETPEIRFPSVLCAARPTTMETMPTLVSQTLSN